MMERKVCLVDGALGHTGSFLVKFLLESEQWHIVATDLAPEDRKKLMTKETIFSKELSYIDCRKWLGENLKYISADLTDKQSLKRLFSSDLLPEGRKNYDVIFHPASLYDYFAEYDLLHKINFGGLKNLLEVIAEHTKSTSTKMPKFLHWSTCGVYGEPKYKKKRGYIYPINENSPFDPPNNYSVTKTEQEKLIFQWSNEHPEFKWIIIRPAPIYGPYQTYGMYHIFYLIRKIGHMPLSLIHPKKKKLMMPMVHVEDLAKAAIFLAEKDEAVGEAYNLCGDPALQEHFMLYTYKTLSVPFTVIPIPWFFYKVMAKILLKMSVLKNKKAKRLGIRPKFDLPMAGYITHQYYFSNQKIKDLGFKFEYGDFKKGIYQTVNWYLDNGWLPSDGYELAKWVLTEPQPADFPEFEYKTPMEGGKVY
ncbi:MAG: NAD-dependent epimerase/dehydratase family protein [Promethearchaeota archaeon]